MGWACAEALEVLADLDALPPAPSETATPALQEAARRSVELVNHWDDDEARSLFADNVELDEALDRRAKEASDAVARHGALTLESFDVDSPLGGDVIAADSLVKIELELNHEGKVQWLLIEDRAKPSDAPIVTDPATLRDLPRSAYVLLRPTGDLVDAFDRWQGEVLDRLSVTGIKLAAPHASMKSFGSSEAPLSDADEERIAALVEAWAAATAPIELKASSLDILDTHDEFVPFVLLDMSDGRRVTLRDLWARAGAADLPAGYSDHIGADGWKSHLSLCYPSERPAPAIVEPLRTWMQHQDVGDARSTAFEAELVAFGDGVERRLGRFPFAGGAATR
jgi:hypothetical protein